MQSCTLCRERPSCYIELAGVHWLITSPNVCGVGEGYIPYPPSLPAPVYDRSGVQMYMIAGEGCGSRPLPRLGLFVLFCFLAENVYSFAAVEVGGGRTVLMLCYVTFKGEVQ